MLGGRPSDQLWEVCVSASSIPEVSRQRCEAVTVTCFVTLYATEDCSTQLKKGLVHVCMGVAYVHVQRVRFEGTCAPAQFCHTGCLGLGFGLQLNTVDGAWPC